MLSKEINAVQLENKVRIEDTQESIVIIFPENFNPENITGNVSLYRPSNQKLDIDYPISISTPNLLIPKSDLAGGRWDIIIDWQYNGKKYLNKEMLNLE